MVSLFFGFNPTLCFEKQKGIQRLTESPKAQQSWASFPPLAVDDLDPWTVSGLQEVLCVKHMIHLLRSR